MIPPEQVPEIRRLFFAEHWRVGTIATQLGLHPDTIRRALATERFARPALVRPSQVDPYRAFLQETLQRYPRLRATRLFEMVRARGYPGSVVQLRRVVRTLRPAPVAEAYLRLTVLPAEQGQADWGSFGPVTIGRATRRLSAFVLVLSWSRALHAVFTLDESLESFLRGHVAAFTAFQGAPRVVLYDNLKSAVLERQGDAIRFHPRLPELCGHSHCVPRPCAGAAAHEKLQASYCTSSGICDAHWGMGYWRRSRKRLPGWARGSGPVGGAKSQSPLSSAWTARSTPSRAKRLAVLKCTCSWAAISTAVSQPAWRRWAARLGIP